MITTLGAIPILFASLALGSRGPQPAIGSPSAPSPVFRAGAPAQRVAAPKAPSAVVTLRTESEAAGSVIRLRDIGTIESADRDLEARLQAVEVGVAPLVGNRRSVSSAYINICLRQNGIHPTRVLILGAPFVSVLRPAQTVAGTQIENVACRFAEKANEGSEAQVAFPSGDLHVPIGRVELKPQTVRNAGATSMAVPVQVLVNGHLTTTVTVNLRLVRRAPILVATRDLLAGTVIESADLKVEERPVTPGPVFLSDPDAAIGQQAAAPIRGGAAIAPTMLKPVFLIKRGARVKLLLRGPAFTITASGEALHDGIKGQPIRVRSLSSLKELAGLVRGSDEVEISF